MRERPKTWSLYEDRAAEIAGSVFRFTNKQAVVALNGWSALPLFLIPFPVHARNREMAKRVLKSLTRSFSIKQLYIPDQNVTPGPTLQIVYTYIIIHVLIYLCNIIN